MKCMFKWVAVQFLKFRAFIDIFSSLLVFILYLIVILFSDVEKFCNLKLKNLREVMKLKSVAF